MRLEGIMLTVLLGTEGPVHHTINDVLSGFERNKEEVVKVSDKLKDDDQFDVGSVRALSDYTAALHYDEGMVNIGQHVDYSADLEDVCAQQLYVCGNTYNTAGDIRECMPTSCQSWMLENTGELVFVDRPLSLTLCDDQIFEYANAGFTRAEMDGYGLLTDNCPTLRQQLDSYR